MNQNQLNRAKVAALTREIFRHHRSLSGLIIRLRPHICPFETILSRFPDGSPTALDVGCGAGILSLLALRLQLATTILGIDTSLKAIALAKQAQGSLDHVRFEHWPSGHWPASSFDVVCCIDVLHHVPVTNQLAFLNQLSAHLKPGGRLIFKDISPRPRWRALANIIHDLLIAHQLVHLLPPASVRSGLTDAGLIIKEFTPLPRLWYSHYLLVAERPASN